MVYYLYRLQNSLKFDKCGATTDWDKRCRDNRTSHGVQSIITELETMEGPDTPEFWQIVGDREWELADLYGYPRGTHYRVAREKRPVWDSEKSIKAAQTRKINGTHRNGGLATKGTKKPKEWCKNIAFKAATLASSQKIWTCEHCDKTGRHIGNYARWHGDKCKHKA